MLDFTCCVCWYIYILNFTFVISVVHLLLQVYAYIFYFCEYCCALVNTNVIKFIYHLRFIPSDFLKLSTNIKENPFYVYSSIVFVIGLGPCCPYLIITYVVVMHLNPSITYLSSKGIYLHNGGNLK